MNQEKNLQFKTQVDGKDNTPFTDQDGTDQDGTDQNDTDQNDDVKSGAAPAGKDQFPAVAHRDDNGNEKVFMSQADLAVLGAQEIVYLKPVSIDRLRQEFPNLETPTADETTDPQQDDPHNQFFAIHAADGTRVAIVQTREAARQAAQQYNMVPLSVH